MSLKPRQKAQRPQQLLPLQDGGGRKYGSTGCRHGLGKISSLWERISEHTQLLAESKPDHWHNKVRLVRIICSTHAVSCIIEPIVKPAFEPFATRIKTVDVKRSALKIAVTGC